MNRIDAFWLPRSEGLRWHRTNYAFYITIFALQVNIACKKRGIA